MPGLLALAWEPARWLFNTWHAPAYASDGGLIAVVVAGLIAASVLSGPAERNFRTRRLAWMLFALTALLRLSGQVLAVHTIGALALVVDVGAIAMLLGVSRRPFAVHPWVLAGLFALSLPLEHHGQRVLGHPLQLLAAVVSEFTLAPFFPELIREGVLLTHPAMRLAVDLPCSGARGLGVFSSVALALWTCHRLSVSNALKLGAALVAGALFANAARIVALFVGGVNNLPVAEEPWHSALGAASLAIGSLPMLAIFRTAPRRRPWLDRHPRFFCQANRIVGRPPKSPNAIPWPAGVAVSVLGLAVASATPHPIDALPSTSERQLPATLGEFQGSEISLAEDEARYFAQWGGEAEKRHYSDGTGASHTALLVRTRSPLRHLHGPDLCLIGAGHSVTRVGVIPGALPKILYKSAAPDGNIWRVEASFVSDTGQRASSVSEVVWLWFEQPQTTWNLVERISPWSLCQEDPERCAGFDRALFAGLDFLAPEHLATNAPPHS